MAVTVPWSVLGGGASGLALDRAGDCALCRVLVCWLYIVWFVSYCIGRICIALVQAGHVLPILYSLPLYGAGWSYIAYII